MKTSVKLLFLLCNVINTPLTAVMQDAAGKIQVHKEYRQRLKHVANQLERNKNNAEDHDFIQGAAQQLKQDPLFCKLWEDWTLDEKYDYLCKVHNFQSAHPHQAQTADLWYLWSLIHYASQLIANKDLAETCKNNIIEAIENLAIKEAQYLAEKRYACVLKLKTFYEARIAEYKQKVAAQSTKDECPICLEAEDEEELIALPCKQTKHQLFENQHGKTATFLIEDNTVFHRFHKECIQTVCDQSYFTIKCPLCRCTHFKEELRENKIID